METLPLIFDPKESLELVKHHNPKLWEVDLVKPTTSILVKVINMGTTLTKALNQCIQENQTMVDRILTMAAYQNIMDKEIKRYRRICGEIDQILKQQEYLNSNRTISEKDKVTLSEFYEKKLRELKADRKSLLRNKEVCRELKVDFETVTQKPTP
ncbi:MAG: hypothetical protein WBG90_05135 [Saonia sp.]